MITQNFPMKKALEAYCLDTTLGTIYLNINRANESPRGDWGYRDFSVIIREYLIIFLDNIH